MRIKRSTNKTSRLRNLPSYNDQGTIDITTKENFEQMIYETRYD